MSVTKVTIPISSLVLYCNGDHKVVGSSVRSRLRWEIEVSLQVLRY